MLGQKCCTLYLSLFNPLNQKFHFQVSVQRNLNRGIYHTLFFDPILAHFTRLLKSEIFVVSDEILAERYFKILHFYSEGDNFF